MRQSRSKTKQIGPDSAAVITIQGSAVKWVPVKEMVEHADMVNRRGKETWWKGIPTLVEALAGRTQFLELEREKN